MESNGEKGHVCISDSTQALLKQNQFICDTLDFTEHNTIDLPNIGRKITSYFVEQIFMSNSVNSSDISSHDYSSGQEDDISARESMSNASAARNKKANLDGALKYKK